MIFVIDAVVYSGRCEPKAGGHQGHPVDLTVATNQYLQVCISSEVQEWGSTAVIRQSAENNQDWLLLMAWIKLNWPIVSS